MEPELAAVHATPVPSQADLAREKRQCNSWGCRIADPAEVVRIFLILLLLKFTYFRPVIRQQHYVPIRGAKLG